MNLKKWTGYCVYLVIATAVISSGSFAALDEQADLVGIEKVNLAALRLAVEDMVKTFPDKYSQGAGYLEQISRYEGAGEVDVEEFLKKERFWLILIRQLKEINLKLPS